MIRILITLCLALLLAACVGVVVRAQDIGLQVSLIPAGVRAEMADSNGRQATWYFKGKQGDVWVAELRDEAGRLIRTEHYNAEGYLVALIHGDGKAERFAPYRCTDRAGQCSYTITEADGRSRRMTTDVRKTGSVWTVYVGGRAKAAYKLGIYNIRTMQRQGTSWTKLKRIEN